MKSKLFVEQNLTFFVNRYDIFASDEKGGKGKRLAFVEQERFAFKEKVHFYSDQSRENLLFSFRAEKVLDVHGRYIVEDANGKTLGIFKKDFGKSLLNSTWNIVDKNDHSLLSVSESNRLFAVVRRAIGFIPVADELFEIVGMLLKYHFTLRLPDKTEVGKYKKLTYFRDHYVLLMDDFAYSKHDWRVLASLCVALDALQSR